MFRRRCALAVPPRPAGASCRVGARLRGTPLRAARRRRAATLARSSRAGRALPVTIEAPVSRSHALRSSLRRRSRSRRTPEAREQTPRPEPLRRGETPRPRARRRCGRGSQSPRRRLRGRRSARSARPGRLPPRQGRRGTRGGGSHRRAGCQVRRRRPCRLPGRRCPAPSRASPPRRAGFLRRAGPPFAERERIRIVDEVHGMQRQAQFASERQTQVDAVQRFQLVSEPGDAVPVVEGPGTAKPTASTSPATSLAAWMIRSRSTWRSASGGNGIRTDSSTRAWSRSTRPALTCVPPRSRAATARLTARTPSRPCTRPPRATKAVSADSGGDDDRFGVRQPVHAAFGLDLHLFARHDVEDVDASRVSSSAASAKSRRWTAKKRSGCLPSSSSEHPFLLGRRAARASARRPRHLVAARRRSRRRGARGPAGAGRRGRVAASRRSGACRGTASH